MAQKYGDRWEVVDKIGEGGQSAVFRVRDLKSSEGQAYALKRLKNPTRLERFEQEIEAIAKLDHPNIVKLVDHNISGDKPFLVMELCEKGSLSREDKLPASSYSDILDLFETICEAVAHAHSHSIIHRDLKPQNILVRADGSVAVADFGICYIDKDGSRHTMLGEAVGARGFTAPELEGGRSIVTEGADVYSLGKLLYWLFWNDDSVPPREGHRRAECDIRRKNLDTVLGFERPELEHINWILDLMIVEDPAGRRDVGNIASLIRRARRLLLGGFTPVGVDVPMLCRFCGDGQYELVAEEPDKVGSFGFQIYNSPSDWRIYRCSRCAHVEFFRPQNEAQKNTWRK